MIFSHPWNCIRLIFPHFMEMPRPTPIILSNYLFIKISRVYKLCFFSHWHPRWFIPHDNKATRPRFGVDNFCSIRVEPAKGLCLGRPQGLSAKHASKEGVKPCGILHCNQFKPWDLSPPKFIGKRKVRIGAIARNLFKLPCSNSSIWVEGTPRYPNLSGGRFFFCWKVSPSPEATGNSGQKTEIF